MLKWRLYRNMVAGRAAWGRRAMRRDDDDEMARQEERRKAKGGFWMW